MESLLQFVSLPAGLIAVIALLVLVVGLLPVNLLNVKTGTNARLIMAILLSLVVLGSALYVILVGGYGEGTEKWAFGAAGTIIGYWLPANT